MGSLFSKRIDNNFFKKWSHEMSYLLGYIAADGCIAVSKDRKKHPFSLNITSTDKSHLYRPRKILKSNHKISKKLNTSKNCVAYQLQMRNPIISKDLMDLEILPRKTFNLKPIDISEKYFSDFVRGFFDGDGSMYIYKVNGVPQIKASFVCISFDFIGNLNARLCKNLAILEKTIHKELSKKGKTGIRYLIDFYIDDCKKLAKFMYGNGSKIFLPRKRNIFNRWKLINRRNYVKLNYPSKVGWQLNKKVLD